MQAAQMAQRLAELEAHKRKNAELKAKREAEASGKAMDKLSHNDIRYRKYTIEDIEVATDYFSNSLKIGEGGYGPVYKGSLDHTPVAIKVLRPDVSQGLKQFKQEVYRVLYSVCLGKSRYLREEILDSFFFFWVSELFSHLDQDLW